MKKTPETMPEYTIVECQREPFPGRREELSGFFVRPIPGEKIEWSEYLMPDRSWFSTTEVTVEGRARIHGQEGLEILENATREVFYHWEKRKTILQVTENIQRPLAWSYEEAAYYPEDEYFRRSYDSFKDNSNGSKYWNLPYKKEMNRKLIPSKTWIREGNMINKTDRTVNNDVVGYYDISFGDKQFHTICFMYSNTIEYAFGEIEYFNEEYLDNTGRIVLVRRFSNFDVHIDDIKETFGDNIPPEEYLLVNGQLFVHYMDAISEYILQ